MQRDLKSVAILGGIGVAILIAWLASLVL